MQLADGPRLTDLGQIHAACWQQLDAASRTRGHNLRVLGLATVDASGLPALRSVVLREVDAAARTLMFFTDARSPKVAQIVAQPMAQMLGWCASLSWQLRISARLEVATDGLALSSRWARLKLKPAAQDYLSPLPPGTPLAGPPGPPPAPVRESRGHFAIVTASVLAIDWLELHREGHRRAQFEADGSGRWCQP